MKPKATANFNLLHPTTDDCSGIGLVDERTKSRCKAKLSKLIEEYNRALRKVSKNKVSEETVRSWLNEFLAVFGWDVRNVKQVWQEAVLDERNRRRLESINSTHKRPDYTLLGGSEIKTFLDAKSLSVDVFADKAVAFQIRSYGWSAQVPCAFVSNFAQLAIFDTRFKPNASQDAVHGVIQIGVDSYLENFDLLFDHLWRGNIISGWLNRLYASSSKGGGKELDVAFMGVLSTFRRKLAVELVEHNPSLISDDALLNYYVQVIMDRIIFIRVCEAKGIEAKERLHEFQNSKIGFWRAFRKSCYMEFYRHYDGAMFSRDARFRQIELPDEVFKDFIAELYYPSPYRFDVIPVMMLAKIYEEFLGKRLVVQRGKVTEVLKGEYVKTNGAVPTPEHIVKLVCENVIADENVRSVSELLSCRFLDPCCGSGVFLIACYSFLEMQFIRLLKSDDDLQREYTDYYIVDDNGNWMLTIPGRRLLIVRCLYGIDVDEAAVEVTKMSLALKMLDGNCVTIWDSLGANGEMILRDIAANVKLGNTLVAQSDVPIGRASDALRAFDPATAFHDVFNADSTGFRFIVCNPPYVETKFFKEAQPDLHTYLSRHYAAYEGKADLAVIFIERCMDLLADNGIAGFIVQRRWFKTDYGKGIRKIINDEKMLDTVIEFDATDIFPRRTTYVAILTLAKCPHEKISHCRIEGSGAEIKALCANGGIAERLQGESLQHIDHPVGDAPWNFDASKMSDLYNRLTESFGRFDAFPGIAIKDGIQALWKKIYHLHDVNFTGGKANGVNGFGESVVVESSILRGVVYNREFYPFKKIEPDAWCLFPYEGATADAIEYSILKTRFPLAYDYLEKNRTRIEDYVECRPGEKWHTFTREHNHGLYNSDKIIVPMTARDVVASYSRGENGLYMDNANVWFVRVDGADECLMKAIAGIMNSTAFSVLAKYRANPQSGGYYKFNKQFLSLVPFPSKRLKENVALQKRIAALSDSIRVLEERYITETANRRELVATRLGSLWRKLDEIAENLYDLNDADRKTVRAVGRTVSRIELLPKE